MTSNGAAETFTPRRRVRAAQLSVYGTAVAAASGMMAPVLLLSAVVGAFDDRSDAAVLFVAASLCAGVAANLLRRGLPGPSLRPVPALTAAVETLLLVAAVSWVVYMVTGAFSVEHALYESTAGVSTSALSVLRDPQELSDGLLVWRSGTQWLGGLIALLMSIGLLPFLGGSRELADPRDRRLTSRALASHPLPALRRVAMIYSIVTCAVVVLFAVLGMSAVDAIAHAFSSVSTGGFSTHQASIAFFDSRPIELAMIVVMLGAGSSVAVVWMLWRRQFRDTRRFFEFRLYVGVLLASTAWVAWLTRDARDIGRLILDAGFTVVSMSSTTGHRIADWGTWAPGADLLLIILAAVGGMAGSAAGGLRWIRVIGLMRYMWRELMTQLHPRSVRSVKIGESSISETSVDRMHAQLVYIMLAGGIGSFLLGLLGLDVVEALGLAVSSVSTTGPAPSATGTLVTAADLTGWQRTVLLPMMLAGRMFLYPAFVAVGASFFAVGRRLQRSSLGSVAKPVTKTVRR